MEPRTLAFLLAASVILGRPAAAQVVESLASEARPALSLAPAAIATLPRGEFMTQLRLQALSLSAASAPLPRAFAATVAAAPAAATPEAFAARAALVQALAAPETSLPALAEAARAAGGGKAENAAAAIEELQQAISASPAGERRGLARAAAALHARFDGASALPGEAVDLEGMPTVDADAMGAKAATRAMKDERRQLRQLQEVLAASKERAVLVVVQGMDTAGKDGVIKRPLALNPAWEKVASFKKPTAAEAAEDFLARVKRQLPQKGIIGVMNRSHYEDLVVPKVYGSFSPAEIESRYRRINEFEKELSDAGVLIVKIFLNVSRAEQKARLDDRLERPEKRWKFSLADLETRKHWDEFHRAYAEVIARTSTPWAPWRVIAADDKPNRDWRVARLLRKLMSRLGLRYPDPPDTRGVTIPD
jgi:PPK2 family polyphosphate:nucleotide phosphotransferase